MSKPKPVKIIPTTKRRRRKRRQWQRRLLLGALLLVAIASLPQGLHKLAGLPPTAENSSLSVVDGHPTITVYNHQSGEIMTLDVEKYLIGVVAAEMPASFETQALKAQAIAARTFAYSRLRHASPNAAYSLTTDPTTCQAWLSDADLHSRWGDDYDANYQKISQAVNETAGQIITYHGQIIEPLYHASCGGGRTEAARDVWGSDRPYLSSVICNHPSDKHTQNQLTITLEALDQTLHTDASVIAAASGSDIKPLAIISSSPSNRVLDIRIGSHHYSGTDLRQALGLKSTLIDIAQNGDTITFTTNGYGHGVGLCQYGAQYYAEQGWDYQAILTHYYTDTAITTIDRL